MEGCKKMTPMPNVKIPGGRLSFKPEGSNEYQDVGTIKTLHITNGPVHTMSGRSAALVVVDDPHDYIAQSAGVLVLKSPAMGKTRTVDLMLHDMAFRHDVIFDHVGPQRSQLVDVKLPDLAKRGPRYVGIKTKKMSGVKGLR